MVQNIVLNILFIATTLITVVLFQRANRNSKNSLFIISGLTAPLIYYFGFVKNTISKKGILVWNFIGLGLLLNIVVNAALSVPTPVQQQAFDQPNIAVLHFPFVWLPSLIVPLVLLAHLASIRQLKVSQKEI